MSARQLLARTGTTSPFSDRHSYVSARLRSARVGAIRARTAAAVGLGERLLPDEQAAFVRIIDTVHDEEDFGDAFNFVD